MNAKELKSAFLPYRTATECFEATEVQTVLNELFVPNAELNLFHPIGTIAGGDAFWKRCLQPLHTAMPDLERRDMIVLAGTTPEDTQWVATMGNYFGTFTAPFLGIPATGHLAHMRYHEFFRFDAGKIIQMQAIWDVPELMMQANAWPLAPQLGAFLCTPAPMSGDGLTATGDGQSTQDHVIAMLTDMCKYPANSDPAIMKLEHYWHPQCNWYGPAGIGTARGIAGFRHWHQIPFLRGMPDRKLDAMGDLMSHWIAEGNYVCETGWPNMRLTLSGDGWMGIAPSNKEVLLRSLDFWRLDNGLIRENWVLVDLLDMYQQIGIDVFARLAEFNKTRSLQSVLLSDGMEHSNTGLQR